MFRRFGNHITVSHPYIRRPASSVSSAGTARKLKTMATTGDVDETRFLLILPSTAALHTTLARRLFVQSMPRIFLDFDFEL